MYVAQVFIWNIYIHSITLHAFSLFHEPITVSLLGQKKKIVMLPSPDQNLKIGSVGRFFLDFFFYTYRERVEFSNIFF